MSHTTPAMPSVPSIPFGTFGPQFDTLVMAMGNKIDREWPARHAKHRGSKALIHQLLRVAENTYHTVRYFAADEPPNPSRKPQFALCISPLARTVLDSLFTTVFLFGDLPERTAWYYRAGWRELYEENVRLNGAYGADPDWTNWLKQHTAFVNKVRVDWGVTAAEEANPKLVPRWPIPPQMALQSSLDADRKAYLEYLTDWFYRALSQDAHLSWPGLARTGAALMPRQEVSDEQWRKMKSDAVMTLVTLLLALVSELELELRYDLKERIKYVWGVTNPFWSVGNEVYTRFYQRFFS